MFFDNIIIFLNVLEQFAIRVNISDFDIYSIIKYVNSTLFFNNDDIISNFLKNKSNVDCVDPKQLVRHSLKDLDKKIINDTIFNKLYYKNVELNNLTLSN